jgi:hypothetical protein
MLTNLDVTPLKRVMSYYPDSKGYRELFPKTPKFLSQKSETL